MRLVVDTNRIIAALAKDSTSRKILFSDEIDFLTKSPTTTYNSWLVKKANGLRCSRTMASVWWCRVVAGLRPASTEPVLCRCFDLFAAHSWMTLAYFAHSCPHPAHWTPTSAWTNGSVLNSILGSFILLTFGPSPIGFRMGIT
jgi:hypothetical protein